MKVTNDTYLLRKKKYFPEVLDSDWQDWRWQVRNRIKNVDDLDKYIKLTEEERNDITSVLSKFRMAITPYYLTLINTDDPNCPIRKQAIPSVYEMVVGGK